MLSPILLRLGILTELAWTHHMLIVVENQNMSPKHPSTLLPHKIILIDYPLFFAID